MAETSATHDVVRIAIDKRLIRGIGVALTAGVVLALTGAFGMDDAPLTIRLIYWLVVMLIGSVWGHLCSRGVERFVDLETRPWLGVMVLTWLFRVRCRSWSGPRRRLCSRATGPSMSPTCRCFCFR